MLSGVAVLKTSDKETMEEVKNEIRDWLKDSKNIENAIIKNHQRFLQRKGINNVEAIEVYRAQSIQRDRQTHCYSCARTLSSFEDLSCSACNWILCSCGACGCGFGN